jgi:hypothetical protein
MQRLNFSYQSLLWQNLPISSSLGKVPVSYSLGKTISLISRLPGKPFHQQQSGGGAHQMQRLNFSCQSLPKQTLPSNQQQGLGFPRISCRLAVPARSYNQREGNGNAHISCCFQRNGTLISSSLGEVHFSCSLGKHFPIS